MSKVIVFATPFFFLLIAIEFFWGRWRAAKGTGQDTYRLNDAVNSISLGILSQVGGVISKVMTIGIYTAVFNAVAWYPHLEFWNTWYGWIIALLFYDFCYYWLHRGGHEVSVLWAAHVVHHQSQHYNLSTALRQTSTGALFGWIFYIPMAIAGVPPLVFGIVALIDLLYQFWVHTEQVGKLGWFDRVFCSPSNHRVHHGVNDPYIDKNYGGLLVVWDRMFGTFQEEHEKCVYGTRGQLNSWDPLWANIEVYAALAKDSWATRHWGDKLRVWLKPPGWQPADLAAANPKPAFTLDQVTTYNPPLSTGQKWFASLQFLTNLGAVAAYLWVADSLSFTHAAMGCAALSASVWALGRFMQHGLSMLEVLAVQAAAIATLGAVDMLPYFMLFKPMVMAIAIVYVAACAISMGAKGIFGTKTHTLLQISLLFSLGGDVFLMLPGDYFIPGLASFLVAHVFYLVIFRDDHAWFPHKGALGVVLAFGAAMYAVLWSHLPDPALKAAVAAYVTVICLMAGQAIGRAIVQGDASARWVAAGACIFMASDSMIAINQFLTPVPLAGFWILLTYYAAQILIVHNLMQSSGAPRAPAATSA